MNKIFENIILSKQEILELNDLLLSLSQMLYSTNSIKFLLNIRKELKNNIEKIILKEKE